MMLMSVILLSKRYSFPDVKLKTTSHSQIFRSKTGSSITVRIHLVTVLTRLEHYPPPLQLHGESGPVTITMAFGRGVGTVSRRTSSHYTVLKREGPIDQFQLLRPSRFRMTVCRYNRSYTLMPVPS